MTDPRRLPFFSECPKASKHSWIWSGFAHKVIWNEDHTEGWTDPTREGQDISKTGPICAFCGIHKRSFEPYPRPIAPAVAP